MAKIDRLREFLKGMTRLAEEGADGDRSPKEGSAELASARRGSTPC